MSSRSFSFITFAGVLILAIACSGDNPAAPGAPSQSAPLSSAIKSDIAASAGNAIASDLETLIANEAAAVGSFAVLVPSSGAFGDDAPASSPSTPPSGTSAPDSAKPPASSPPSGEPKPPASTPPSGEPQPAPAPAPVSESCSFNAAALIYSCVKSGEGQSVVKSYQFLDASGKPMEKFVRGTTEAIHFLVKSAEGKSVVKSYQFLDASGQAMDKFVKGTTESIRYRVQSDGTEVRDNRTSASHSLRYVTVSGFLGPNRVWNGFGNSADTTSYKEDVSTRNYTGLSVDTLKAVTFVDERATHPYPLSGVAVRVVDYTVVSTGKQLETTTVHKRVVVTFNGTADVPISLGDYSCVLHLDTHKVDGCK